MFLFPLLEIVYSPSKECFSPPPLKPEVFGCDSPKTILSTKADFVLFKVRFHLIKSTFVSGCIVSIDLISSSPGVLPTKTISDDELPAEQEPGHNRPVNSSIKIRNDFEGVIIFQTKIVYSIGLSVGSGNGLPKLAATYLHELIILKIHPGTLINIVSTFPYV